MAITFGLDISHHQARSLDLAACRRDGCAFVFCKATEGSSHVDSHFGANLAEARAAGLLVAAYHYVRSSASAAAQAAHIASVVPRDVPVIPDVEAGSGGVALTRDLVRRLRAAGYRVPLLYLPRWYWQQLGSPSLAGLPPLWSSRYPDMAVGTLAAEWADVPAHYWTGYGGLPVAVLQFTSSARIGGYAPLDANAYRGTRAQLAALLSGTAGGTGSTNNDQRLTAITGGTQMRTMPQGGGKNENDVRVETFAMSVLHEHDIIFAPTSHALILRALNTWKQQRSSSATTNNRNPGGVGDLLKGKEWHVQINACKSFRIPKGIGRLDVAYWCDGDTEVTIEPVIE